MGGPRERRSVVLRCHPSSALAHVDCTALMEYHCGNKDVQVASRIFEKGMEAFGDEVEYVLRYLGFLISINDENSKSFFGFAVAPY